MDKRYRNLERRTGRKLGKIFRSHVENCLKSIWETCEVEPDGDGDYAFLVGQSPGWVSVRDRGTTPSVRVFAYACVDLGRTAKLLTELNEINVGSAVARVFWTNDTVVVEASLPWQLLDQRGLEFLIDEVGGVTLQVAELISVVHGGRLPVDGLVVADADDDAA